MEGIEQRAIVAYGLLGAGRPWGRHQADTVDTRRGPVHRSHRREEWADQGQARKEEQRRVRRRDVSAQDKIRRWSRRARRERQPAMLSKHRLAQESVGGRAVIRAVRDDKKVKRRPRGRMHVARRPIDAAISTAGSIRPYGPGNHYGCAAHRDDATDPCSWVVLQSRCHLCDRVDRAGGCARPHRRGDRD